MGMNVRQILEKRADLIGEARALVDLADKEKREMTSSERKTYDVIMADVKQLRTDAETQTALESPPGAALGGAHWVSGGGAVERSDARFLTKEQRVADAPAFAGEAVDPFKQIRGWATGNWEGADNEKRAMGENIGGSGGFLLSPQASGTVIDIARNAACVIQAGASTFLMDTSEAVLATALTDPTAVWLPELGTLSPTDLSLGAIHLKAETLAAMCQVSIQLAQDSKNIDAIISHALTSAIALELDRAAILGSGIAQPRGIYDTPLVNQYSMGINGAIPTSYDAFLYAMEYVRNANGNPTAVIMSPRTAGTLSRLKEGTTNAPLPLPVEYSKLQAYQTNQIGNAMTWGSSSSSSTAILGDFARGLVIGLAPSEGGSRQIRVDISRDFAFDQLSILIRAYIRADIAVIRPTFFTRICGLLA